jgi:8-oxo-dGTP diphosphatase
MPDRLSSARATPRGFSLVVDVVLFTPRCNELAALLVPIGESGKIRSRDRWVLPSDTLRGDESLQESAWRISYAALGVTPTFLEQAATLGGARRYADGTQVTVLYFGLVPASAPAGDRVGEWMALSTIPTVVDRHLVDVDVALASMRARVDQQPIAFRLLPPEFTLSELQAVYELLLGRRLHKASFRRSLHASALVEPADEWRSEGRGRPAQLFRYAPPPRKRQRRGIRFDLLG